MKKLLQKISILIILISLFANNSSAYTIDFVGRSNNNDILLSPARVEVRLDSGESEVFDLTLTNRLERVTDFNVEVVKVIPAGNNEEVVNFDREDVDYPNLVRPELQSFRLEPGERIVMPVEVTADQSIDHGGYFYSILFSEDGSTSQSPAVLQSRIGALVFVRLGDDIREAGLLRNFQTADNKETYFSKKVPLAITFENLGNVHLNPYGVIEVKNLFGQVKENVQIRPWFVLPSSTRTSTAIKMDSSWKFGKYSLELKLNRGYSNEIDRETIEVYVFSWQWLVTILILILLLLAFVWRIRTYKGISSRREILLYVYISILILALGLVVAFAARAERATSTNYILERDSINIGGLLSTSTNYSLEDTLGEVGTGRGTSTNYILEAGYQQLDSTVLTITSPADVTLSPDISSSSGGQADGSASWTVTTNNSNGYSLTIKASSNPAMRQVSGSDSFADYTAPGASPQYGWVVANGEYEFGYSPHGDDVTSNWKDNGSDTCNTGSNITDGNCWEGFTTGEVTIASSASGNYPTGTDTKVNFRAESNNASPEAGDYQATLTLTALAL